jgi:hypothetical protein
MRRTSYYANLRKTWYVKLLRSVALFNDTMCALLKKYFHYLYVATWSKVAIQAWDISTFALGHAGITWHQESLAKPNSPWVPSLLFRRYKVPFENLVWTNESKENASCFFAIVSLKRYFTWKLGTIRLRVRTGLSKTFWKFLYWSLNY